MTETDGVIQYKLDFTETAAPEPDAIADLNSWRRIMYLLGLIGQTPDRYDGYGYGNISRRGTVADGPDCAFVITGSQTGHLAHLEPTHFATVTHCDPKTNQVRARGVTPPSSEALAHGALYAADPAIGGVIHAHCPEIWRWGLGAGLPHTEPDAACGTPEIARQIGALCRRSSQSRGIFILAGHEDGVVAFGDTVETAGLILTQHLAHALSVGPPTIQ